MVETTSKPRLLSACPCGSEKNYAYCCAPYHQNFNAPTALCLMKSRYSAYVLGLVEYLVKTTHPSAHTKHLREDIAFTCKHIEWQGLEIVSFWKGEEEDKVGKVHFRAQMYENKRQSVHEEHSRFKHFGKVWMYLDAQG